MNDIALSATAWGVEPGYHDVFGNWHAASADTMLRLTEALSLGRTAPVIAAMPPSDGLRAYQGDNARTWGLAVQLYAVRSLRNWGIGDFTDLGSIIEQAARSGAGAVGLNPLHALFLDQPANASPYAPNSRLFLNPLYIDVEAVPEFPGLIEAGLASDVAALRTSELVDYGGVAKVKLAALRLAYDRFVARGDLNRQQDFASFSAAQGEKLLRFSCFEVLRRRFMPLPWRQWSNDWRNPSLAALEELRRSEQHECGFHEFLQWIADQQLAGCTTLAQQHQMSIGLYLDLAVGVDPDGVDAWSNQTAILANFSVGAPPDEFNPAGQDWGLAPLNPHTLPDNNFAVIRELLGAAMRHAGAVRLDHVLGLMRLFLVPHGKGADNGAYVRFPFEPLLRVVAEESNRHACIFIGEDLGTVPDGFREVTARWGVWTYRVMMFERWDDGTFKPPSEYPGEALATFNTHDLPTFRGWMNGHDLLVKHAIGIDPGESEEGRQRSRDALRHVLSQTHSGLPPEDFAAAAAHLAATPARLVMIAVEDMLDVVEQVNIPGTVDQHPNWRRNLPIMLEDWSNQPVWKDVTSVFENNGRLRAVR